MDRTDAQIDIQNEKKNKVQNIQNQHLLNKYSRQKRAKFTICVLFALAERTVYVLYHWQIIYERGNISGVHCNSAK